MILKDPYQFRALKAYNINKIKEDINKYIVIDYAHIKQRETVKLNAFRGDNVSLNSVILYGLSDIEKDIPAFNHPVVNTENNWIALDLRSTLKLNENKDFYEIRNESEYNLSIRRFILTGIFSTGHMSAVYGLQFPHIVYGEWLSDNLTKKFGLDMHDKLKLNILAQIYYTTLFNDFITQEDIEKLGIRNKDNLFVTSLLTDVYSSIEKLENIDDFCAACYSVTRNVRLKNLDFIVLANVLGNNWMSSYGKDLVLLALDHPPTWISIVYSALTQKSFKKSYITTIVDKLNKKKRGEEFLQSLVSLTHEYKQE